MQLNIYHETFYRYTSPARHSIQLLRLTPRADPLQRIVHWNIQAPARLWAGDDAYGNRYHTMAVSEPHAEIRVVVRGAVVITQPEQDGVLAHREDRLSPLAFLMPTRLTGPTKEIREFACAHLPEQVVNAEQLLALGKAISGAMTYRTGVTESQTTAADAFTQGSGVCQDHAHVFIACCRTRGVPARYVSGYVEADANDHAASHAWAQAWLPDLGWVSVDVTHGLLVADKHCSLAIGRDFDSASPVRGARTGGGNETLQVTVSVSADQ